MKWTVVSVFLLCVVSLAVADGEVWEDEDHEVLIRNVRGVQNKETCRYVKGAWSECDPKTNMRSRTLTLKKGDAGVCEPSKVVQRNCKRGCRYEKAAWSQCKENGEMTRTDTLKPNSDSTCEANRQVSRKCNKNKATKNNKDKGSRRNRQ